MQNAKNPLLGKIESHVRELFEKYEGQKFKYHNLNHTLDVVEASKEMAKAYKLIGLDQEVLLAAAWFHDTGCWIRSKLENHEKEGAELAREFLLEEGIEKKFIERVQNCIQSTQMPQSPKNLIEEILCDADLSHLGKPEYFDRSLLLREELVQLKVLDMDELSWLKSNLIFLGKHEYHTEYAQKSWTQGKSKNMALLVEEIDKRKKSKKKKPKKEKSTERGVETLFRTTSRNHLELSSIADNKANIMISVNSIILTIIVSVLLRKLEEYPNFIIPTVILLGTSLTTMVFAILATRPNVTSGRVTQEAIDKNEANLLYFGNFHKMSLQEYEEGMGKMMKDAEFLYGSMTKDIYYLGKVLAKKYILLRKSYTVFMFGFIISILAFLVASIFFPVDTY
ncbi:DUF5706 domain-containing protein [Echinicola jeungdonensis]|uniref:Pycsar system effector family protein n=1 Tax=Echinicola jeungdonensis TaxID=709343 RepID=A0ABV5J4Q5_9BACT|nr:Pycsar system effector family protein [Echinicola jeungdonensis]MDN3668871.1 DUF5706 domain-containing protein [Echinicola jeungdonensis]